MQLHDWEISCELIVFLKQWSIQTSENSLRVKHTQLLISFFWKCPVNMCSKCNIKYALPILMTSKIIHLLANSGEVGSFWESNHNNLRKSNYVLIQASPELSGEIEKYRMSLIHDNMHYCSTFFLLNRNNPKDVTPKPYKRLLAYFQNHLLHFSDIVLLFKIILWFRTCISTSYSKLWFNSIPFKTA